MVEHDIETVIAAVRAEMVKHIDQMRCIGWFQSADGDRFAVVQCE